MENKFSEQELIKAFKEQDSIQLSPTFVAKVMQSIDTQNEAYSVWGPVLKFAALNSFLALLLLGTGLSLMDPVDFGFECLVNSGVLI